VPEKLASTFNYLGRVGPSANGLWEGGGREWISKAKIPALELGEFHQIPWSANVP